MGAFRNHTPKRQLITKEVGSHTDHREELISDFKKRCGYCDDCDTWRFAWFEIDHFVPQKHLVSIKKTDYSNLVYACRSCNNSKRAHWPTLSETVHNQNNVGFIDPCDDSYNDQFSRSDSGRILPDTEIGQWIYNKLKFYKPQHEIIWNIEQLDLLITECKDLLKNLSDSVIKDRLLLLYDEYHNYTKQLGNIN